MKKIVRLIRRPFVLAFVNLVYLLGCICYDKKYLTGRYFDRRHFTVGWRWILKFWFPQKVLRLNNHVPWPVPPYVLFGDPTHIIFDPDDMQNFHGAGSYFQGLGATITIGKGSLIAAGTGLITANHSFEDIEHHQPGKEIVLGEKCWIGMNCVILPGIHLGAHTVVGAGSVVTKSFPEGHCVIAGNPARVIREGI